eukprot:g16332.t1
MSVFSLSALFLLTEALLQEVEDERQRRKRHRGDNCGRKAQLKAQLDAAAALMAGQVGVYSTYGRLPLQLLTKQKCVAWRWPQENGVMQHMYRPRYDRHHHSDSHRFDVEAAWFDKGQGRLIRGYRG